MVEKLTANGPADRAGIKVGDVITECDGESIDSAAKLTAAIRSKAANSKVTLKLTRDGKEITVEATLGDADANN